MIQQIKQKINTVFSDLNFESQRHLYFINGDNYPSVSSLVDKHSEKFNPSDEMMIACVKKYNRENGENITEHELKHKWQTTNKEACELGTETHDFLENYTGLETPSTPQQKAGIAFLKEILKDYEIIAKELRMYSRKYKYAGTADLILIHRVTGNIVIADYKTNKDLFKTFGNLKEPFSYLESHPYNKYQLQLSYYQIMLEEVRITISDRLLVYLKADGTHRIFNTIDFTGYLKTYLDQTQKVIEHDNW